MSKTMGRSDFDEHLETIRTWWLDSDDRQVEKAVKRLGEICKKKIQLSDAEELWFD